MKWYLSISIVTKWKAIRSALPLPRPQSLQLSVHCRPGPVSIKWYMWLRIQESSRSKGYKGYI